MVDLLLSKMIRAERVLEKAFAEWHQLHPNGLELGFRVVFAATMIVQVDPLQRPLFLHSLVDVFGDLKVRPEALASGPPGGVEWCGPGPFWDEYDPPPQLVLVARLYEGEHGKCTKSRGQRPDGFFGQLVFQVFERLDHCLADSFFSPCVDL